MTQAEAKSEQIGFQQIKNYSATSEPTTIVKVKERVTNQYIAAIIASISTFATGNVIGWTSQISPKLLEGEMGFPINSDNLGWIASLALLGAAGLALLTGTISDKLGRKRLLLILVIPMILGWISIYFAKSVELVYFGRFLTGMIGGANCALFSVYSNEIASDKIRGTLGSLNNLMLSVGILFDAILGRYLSIPTYIIVCAVVPAVFGAAFFFMPESPIYLIKTGKNGEAKRALLFLRGKEFNADAELKELSAKMNKTADINKGWRNLYNYRTELSGRNAMIVAVGLMTFRVFVGIDAITSYAAHIFKSAEMDFDPQIGTIVLIVIQVSVGIFQSSVIDKVGRRVLLLLSSVIVIFCLGTVSICLLLKEREIIDQSYFIYTDYLLLLALCAFYTGYTLGLGPIPFLMVAELFPVETKSTASAVGIFITKIWAFVVSKTFIIIKDNGGQDMAFMLYTVLSVMGLVFIFVKVPETKGKSSQEIIDLLGKQKREEDNISSNNFKI